MSQRPQASGHTAGPGPVSTVLVKPAGPDCNMACSYCFYRDKRARYPGHPRMSGAVLEALLSQALAQGGPEVTFVWQGGEPTLLGVPFYERVVELQQRLRRPGQRVANALMTNGLLLDEAWCRLLRAGGFLVGLSLDGPADLHDLHRRTAAGQPTGEQVMGAARLLLEHGVPVNALVLASAQSCGRGREIYRTLTGLGLTHLQLVPCVETDADGSPAPFSVEGERFGELLLELFACWRADFRHGVPGVSVRWLDAVLQRYLGLPATECTLAHYCGGYVTVEHDGDAFSCDFFVDDEHRLGNLLATPLVQLLNSPAQRGFGQAKAAVAAPCRACTWLPLCQGGCPRHRLAGHAGRSALCSGYQRFFAEAHPAMIELARGLAAATSRPPP